MCQADRAVQDDSHRTQPSQPSNPRELILVSRETFLAKNGGYVVPSDDTESLCRQ